MTSSAAFRVTVSVEPVPAADAAAAGDGSVAVANEEQPQPKQQVQQAQAQAHASAQNNNKRVLEMSHETEGAAQGAAQHAQKKQKTDTVVLEKGRIHFFYRPKVHPVDAPSVVHGLDDIQKTEIILSPLESKDLEQRKAEDDIGATGARAHQHEQKQENGDIKQAANDSAPHSVHFPHRMIRIPKKVLPSASAVSSGGGGGFVRPLFGYVEMTSSSLHELDVDLSTHTYDTATRGVREQPAARLVASGIYEILRHHTPYNVESPTYLAYVLEFPKEMGQAQQLLNIKQQGEFMIQIRNPNVGPTTQGGFTGLPEKAKYPQELMQLFEGVRVAERRFIPLDPVDFLNYHFCEMLMMPVKNSSDIVKEWGSIGEDLIKQAEMEKESTPSDHVVEKVASELELNNEKDKTDIDVTPAVTGKLQ